MKKVVRVICFSILSILILCTIYKVLSWKDTMGLTGSSVNQLAHTEKDTMDVVIVGSSHVYHGILPATLWTEYGIAGFDMSISAMDKDSAYYNLKHLCETQSPKVVCVDVLPLLYEKHAVQGNVYRNMLSLPYSKNAIDLVDSYVSEEERMDYILKFPIIHTRYKELTKADFYDSEYAIYGRGERISFVAGGNPQFEIANTYTGCGELSERNTTWLDNMMEMAETEGYELVFLVTPFQTDESEQGIMNAAARYVTDKGYRFLDGGRYTNEIGLDPQTDYSDPEHMNSVGAQKMTSWLGAYLESICEFEDHTGDERYDLWNKDAYYLENARFMSVLEGANFASYEEWLQFITTMPNVTYVVSLDGAWETSTLPLADYMECLNIPSEEVQNGGAWVGALGENTKLADNSFEGTIYYDLDRYSSIRIKRTESETQGNIYINNTSCQYVKDGMNVSIYNHITREIKYAIALY